MKKEKQKSIVRSPIIAIMGHIDHGKSTLLDYIRKSNTVDKEAGGITQHLGTYEVLHTSRSGEERTITFLDTPGHEAFSKMRSRGAEVADIVILVVAADDGVNVQTIEAFKTIEQAKTPYIVAINKIDKPNANVEKTKIDLATAGVYLEGFGGAVPFIPISAKTGVGVEDLLDMVFLVAEMSELTKDNSKQATGFVIESNLDPRKGGSATLIIKDGTLRRGDFIIIGKNITTVRSIEDSSGSPLDIASAPSPIKITSFSEPAVTGAKFRSTKNKKDAEIIAAEVTTEAIPQKDDKRFENAKTIIPVVLKADVSGSLEAIERELLRLETEEVKIKFIIRGVGNISENDIKIASGSQKSLIIGFNVKINSTAKELANNLKLAPQIFNIIYQINPIVIKEIANRNPKIAAEETIGRAKILKIFSKTKDRQIIGGLVYEGTFVLGKECKIFRQMSEIGRGTIVDLQQQKLRTQEVVKGNQFGALIESKITMAPDDTLEMFDMVQK